MKLTNHSTKEFIAVYKKRPVGHNYIVFPKLLELMGNISGKRILDLGCGVGDLSKQLAERGAFVDAVDISREMIDTAKRENQNVSGITYLLSDAENLGAYKDKTFDFVVMNMVLINVDSKDKIQKIFLETSRVLKDNGIFLFTDLHPIALMVPNTTTQNQGYLEGFSYFKDASLFSSNVLLNNGKKIDFVDIHWTLESYFLMLNKAGLFVKSLIEPQPIKNSPKVFETYLVPEYLIFCCNKLIIG